MKEYDDIGKTAFLERFSSGRPPKAHYIWHDEKPYPLKAIWAAAHVPTIHTRDCNTAAARKGVEKLKFETFIESSLAEQFEEGDRIRREVTALARNPELVTRAKKHYGSVCRACDFDFKAQYGELGAGYIECHHIDPLSGRDGRSKPTTIADVTVLCANCHRMVHRRTPCLTIEELKCALDEAPARKS
jgi:hypothetical protein